MMKRVASVEGFCRLRNKCHHCACEGHCHPEPLCCEGESDPVQEPRDLMHSTARSRLLPVRSYPHLRVSKAKVKSSSGVILDHNEVRALPFYVKRQNDAHLSSTHLTSWSHTVHRMHMNEHVGSHDKRLVPYHPSAPRNRLQRQEEKYMESNASSHFMIGKKRTPQDLLNLNTTYRHFYCSQKRK